MSVTIVIIQLVLLAATTHTSIRLWRLNRKWKLIDEFGMVLKGKTGEVVDATIQLRVRRSCNLPASEEQRISREFVQTLERGEVYARSRSLPDILSSLDEPAHEQELQESLFSSKQSKLD